MENKNILLSILIPTVVERKQYFDNLMEIFNSQLDLIKDGHNIVESLYFCDNKEISIGTKRQRLLEMAKGQFIVFFDDDDKPYDYYIYLILKAIKENKDIDCIGFKIDMTTNGTNPKKCLHSLSNKEWRNGLPNEEYDYYRNVTHFNPVCRDLALIVGFQDLRFGEDKEYSDKLTKLCHKEYMIEQPMFHYMYSDNQPHNQKYGI